MVVPTEDANRLLLKAISFAARAHHGQMRKDGETPYVSHVFRVCMVLRQVFEIDDAAALTVAVLHDTIEDTRTDFDDLEEQFGAEIAGWVALLSKDKRQPFAAREQSYCDGLAKAAWQVQVCKLADVFDNLLDTAHLEPGQRPRAIKNKRRYLDAIKSALKPEASIAWSITAKLCNDLAAQNGEDDA